MASNLLFPSLTLPFPPPPHQHRNDGHHGSSGSSVWSCQGQPCASVSSSQRHSGYGSSLGHRAGWRVDSSIMGKSLAELFGPRRAAAGASRGRAAAKAHAGVKPSLGPSKRQKQPLAQMKRPRRPPSPPRKQNSKKQPLGLLEETQAEHAKKPSQRRRTGCMPSLPVRGRCFQMLPLARSLPGSRWRLGPGMQTLRRVACGVPCL